MSGSAAAITVDTTVLSSSERLADDPLLVRLDDPAIVSAIRAAEANPRCLDAGGTELPGCWRLDRGNVMCQYRLFEPDTIVPIPAGVTHDHGQLIHLAMSRDETTFELRPRSCARSCAYDKGRRGRTGAAFGPSGE